MRVPKKVQNCTTHHACDCILFRSEKARTALAIIWTWAKCDALDNVHVSELCDEVLTLYKEKE